MAPAGLGARAGRCISRMAKTLARVLLVVGVVLGHPGFASAHNQRAPVDVAVTSTPLIFDLTAPARTRFGELEWRGGIDIRSPNPEFGGISGLILGDDGTGLVAISDDGRWLTANLIYRDGRLTGLENVVMAPVLGAPGEILEGKHDVDSEGLGRAINGNILVSFERYHRIARYEFESARTPATATYLPLPDEADDFLDNKGLEAIGQFPGGSRLGERMLTIAERYLDGNGNHTGWLMGDGDPVRLQFERVEDFDITALTILPDGRLILLERAFSVLFGPAMRLRLVEQSELRAGQVIAGRELLRADSLKTIDNMEGLTNHVSKDGETILTLISDNNFRSFQRTLMMQFALR